MHDSTETTIFSIKGNLDGEEQKIQHASELMIGIKIAHEEFYLPIQVIDVIVMLKHITYLPLTHPFIEGVVNLRGIMIPTLNLRKMLALPQGSYTPSVRNIIVKHENVQVGLLVDKVTFVSAFLTSEIEHQSLPAHWVGTALISRISKKGNEIRGILDVAKILEYFSTSAA